MLLTYFQHSLLVGHHLVGVLLVGDHLDLVVECPSLLAPMVEAVSLLQDIQINYLSYMFNILSSFVCNN